MRHAIVAVIAMIERPNTCREACCHYIGFCILRLLRENRKKTKQSIKKIDTRQIQEKGRYMLVSLVLLQYALDFAHGKKTMPQRMFIVSHQRSGTHFTSNLISNALTGRSDTKIIQSELVNSRNGNSSKSVWSQEVKHAFDGIERAHPTASVVGFIMQENHIWCTHEFKIIDKLTQARLAFCMQSFAEWCQRQKIKVVHLVREATLLVESSGFFAKRDDVSNTRDKGVAEHEHESVLDHPMRLNDSILKAVDRLDKLNEIMKDKLARTLQVEHAYLYLRYESLIDLTRRENTLKDVLIFLEPALFDKNASVSDNTIKAAFNSLRSIEVRPPSCASRILDWDHAKHKLKPSTRYFCEEVDTIYKVNTRLAYKNAPVDRHRTEQVYV